MLKGACGPFFTKRLSSFTQSKPAFVAPAIVSAPFMRNIDVSP